MSTYKPYESHTIPLYQPEYGNCALIQDLLPLYMEGEVSPGTRDQVVEHLARCERCAGFLAGAQTTRVQLRRTQPSTQSATSVRVSIAAPFQTPAPARFSSFRYVLGFAIAIPLLIVSFLCTLALWQGIDRGETTLGFVGLVVGLACFAALVMTARAFGELTAARWIQLITSCIVGMIGVVLLASPGSGILLGPILCLIGSVGVLFTLFQRPATNL